MKENSGNMPDKTQFLLYTSEDGKVKIETRMQNQTVWLTQTQMAELFQTTQQNVSLHIQNIFESAELNPESTHKKYLSVRREGSRDIQRNLVFYNLDMIISVGYRVNSLRGTQFRIWATQQPPSSPFSKGELKNTDISALEKQIDELVYALYDLTPEEIAIVEGRE